MAKEHGHSPEEVAERLSADTQGTYLKDMVYGGIDGAVTTFAIVAGVEGAGLSHGIIVALGIANILADGFSMAAGNYSGTKAELDDRRRIVRVEENHIEHHRDGELEELRQILALRGLSGEVLEEAVREISNDKEKWISLMLTFEYGLTLEEPHPMRAALATFGAFLVAGSVPLLPFILNVPQAFQVSIVATLVTFFLIGTGKSRWSLAKWWWSGGETLLIGTLAAIIAYVVGGLFHAG
ncbi:VIT1/CCC1 transporter family protein [Marimonas sp. MJW-29]|uniref:VIT1/CCC1 transporter family protein n=1 Tax=Sulfitobacter sediminis TaxID=3234186 RepID=A0ABV3RSW9_9RHOB